MRNKSTTTLPKHQDLSGRRYGHLVVVKRSSERLGTRCIWVCDCDCGTKGCLFPSSYLNPKGLKSCGCAKAEKLALMHARTGRKTSEYNTWINMISRCCSPTNPDFADYGGRGITVCDRWRLSFESFLEDMGPKPPLKNSIDRIKNELGYFPGNCRWADATQQARNRGNNRLVTANGMTLTVMEWSERVGIPYTTLIGRLNIGWSDQETVAISVADGNKRKGRRNT